MNNRIKLLFIFSLIFTFSIRAQVVRKFYVGTFTSEGAEGIYLCDFDTKTGDISLSGTIKGVDNPSFLKVSPDRNYLYVVTRSPAKVEESGGYVSAYKIKGDGSLHFLNKQISNGTDPCHVDVSPDGKFVAIATYGSGTTSLYPTGSNGKLLPATTVIINEGSGPVTNRQSKPHAHSIKFSPFGKEVFVADLGTDQLNIFWLEGDQLKQYGQKFAKFAPGTGPRHFDFHPNGKVIYVIGELNSTITSFKKRSNSWKPFQVISALPASFTGTSYSADIHVSANGKYLYGSNRGDNSIATFVIESSSQRLIKVGTVSTEGNWPRNFTLTPDGGFMLVANQKSGNITVFKINSKSGVPKYIGKQLQLPSPVCLEFL
ncbi:MAG: lactonase family protein [Prolixibacteraceae bacterium]|nr:lactonase family protein [Prolixibacteraceae bacterium]